MSKSKSRLLSELTGSDGSVDGRDVSADGTKLDGIANNANNYTHPASHSIGFITGLQGALDGKVDDTQVLTNVPANAVFTDTVYTHPTGDGNLHVPATSTNNDGKILTAGSTAGSISWQDAPVSLPAQSTHNGKFLTTDGTAASWADVDALPDQTGNNGKFLTTDGSAASWVDNDTTVSKVTYEYTATAGQTTFSGADNNGLTLAYTSGNTLVTYGGFDLPFSDFTATNGTSVVLTDGAEAGKIVRIIAFETFDVANTYTQAETDAGFVAKDSNGNVGIGTTSPADKLVVDGGTLNGTTYIAATNNHADQFITMGINANVGEIAVDNNDVLTFGHYENLNNKTYSERMRIDSSGNVLVGKTSASATSLGVEARANGLFAANKSGGASGYFGRQISDGNIVEFNKDGTTVGSISAVAGDLAIGTGDAGLKFRDEFDCIQPHNMSTNVTTDGVLSLGKTGVRFKDLYLSGGVYLGGTGSANHLDDYEEGTWTPAMNGGSFSGSYANRYTKIGNLVTLDLARTIASITSGNNFTITGLPFAPIQGVWGGGVWTNAWDVEVTGIRYWSSGTSIAFYKSNGSGGVTIIPQQDVGAGGNVYAQIQYWTNS